MVFNITERCGEGYVYTVPEATFLNFLFGKCGYRRNFIRRFGRAFREIDTVIQGLNWSTDLIE